MVPNISMLCNYSAEMKKILRRSCAGWEQNTAVRCKFKLVKVE